MSAPATNGSLPRSDEDAIRAVVADADRHQSDADTLLALHTENAIVVNAPGRRVLGRDAFADAMHAALATPLRDVRTSLEVEDIRLVTADVALVSCIKTIHDERDSAGSAAALPSSGALTYVVVRSTDTWRIALAQTTPRL